MAEPTHIGLFNRKALAAQLCLYDALREFDGAHSTEAARLIEQFDNELTKTAAFELAGEPEEIRLDRRIRELGVVAFRNTRNLYSPRRLVELRPLYPALRAYRSALKHVSCDECSEQVCTGCEQDHRVVTNGGRCISSLKHVFQIARETSTCYYQQYVPDTGLPLLLFSTISYNGSPHSLTSPIAVSGETEVHTDGFTEVKLAITVNSFDRPSYHTILYVLLHEILVHGFEGARRLSKATDTFAEGWMDYVVGNVILDELDRGVGPAGHLRGRLADIRQDIEFGSHFYLARGDRRFSTSANAIQMGREAASRFRAAMRRENPAAELTHFLNFSLQLNTMNLSHSDRLELVNRIYHWLPKDERTLPPKSHRIIVPLRRFLAGGATVEELAQQLLA